jgi:hypothetical protein
VGKPNAMRSASSIVVMANAATRPATAASRGRTRTSYKLQARPRLQQDAGGSDEYSRSPIAIAVVTSAY